MPEWGLQNSGDVGSSKCKARSFPRPSIRLLLPALTGAVGISVIGAASRVGG